MMESLPKLAQQCFDCSSEIISTITDLENQPYIETISADLRAMRESAQKANHAAEQALSAYRRFADKADTKRESLAKTNTDTLL
jgi:hypothetical protein